MPHNAAVSPDLPESIRLHRVALLGDWRDRFAHSLENSCLSDLRIPNDLLPALFEEILGLLEGGGSDRIPCYHRPPVVGRLADFPANVSVCLKLLNAGEASLRSFLEDSCPAFATGTDFERECFLWDLNKATHILIHREIQGICEQSLRPITEICGRVEGHGDIRRHQTPAPVDSPILPT